MKDLQLKVTPGTKFLIKLCEDITQLAQHPVIMTPYYEMNLKFYSECKWNGNEVKIKRLARGLCLGLTHMHQCGFAHRDIKSANILLQNAKGDPVIIDFGLVNDN